MVQPSSLCTHAGAASCHAKRSAIFGRVGWEGEALQPGLYGSAAAAGAGVMIVGHCMPDVAWLFTSRMHRIVGQWVAAVAAAQQSVLMAGS
jgi:hypothetical protein